MTTILEFIGWGLLTFVGICLGFYVLSIVQMRGWLYEIKNFLDMEFRDYKLKKEHQNEDKKE